MTTALPNEYAFDLRIAAAAARTWRDRTGDRAKNEQLWKEGRYDEVEPKERLARHANRMLATVKRHAPAESLEGFSDTLRDYAVRPALAPEEIDNATFERVIGETRDFLSVEFLERGLVAMRCVGRIVTALGAGRSAFGTGFLVSPGLLLTNNHVLRDPARAAASHVEFDFQVDRAGDPLKVQRFALLPEDCFLTDVSLDFALVAVADTSAAGVPLATYGRCRLLGVDGKAVQESCLNIVQHPRGEMKQVVIRENKLVDRLEKVLHYEGDTEPGSSGSPVFNDLWEVVALHHSGVPKSDEHGNLITVDNQIWRAGDDPARLAWVANEGIRVSRLVAHLKAAVQSNHLSATARSLLNDAIDPSALATPAPLPPPVSPTNNPPREPTMPPTPEHTTPKPPIDDATHAHRGAVGEVSLTIPLRITVSLGAVGDGSPDSGLMAGPAPATRSGGTAISPLEKIEPDPDYDSRPGYDEDFLGFSVPLPTLRSSIVGDAAKDERGRPLELKYYHYSVIMNARRRLAFVSAVNFDAGAGVRHKREGGDHWFEDPRIDSGAQADNRFYSNNPLDRGHLARRADAAWGQTEAEAKLANDDTFHFTNCSPQHEVYNQATKADAHGLLLWGNIEEHIAAQAKRDGARVSVFNGPVFGANDPMHRGLRVPREFWKIVVFERDAGNPGAAAFVLSQESLIQDLPEEEFVSGPYRPFQKRVSDLERLTKLDFGNLRSFDTLSGTLDREAFADGRDAAPIDRLEDIVL